MAILSQPAIPAISTQVVRGPTPQPAVHSQRSFWTGHLAELALWAIRVCTKQWLAMFHVKRIAPRFIAHDFVAGIPKPHAMGTGRQTRDRMQPTAPVISYRADSDSTHDNLADSSSVPVVAEIRRVAQWTGGPLAFGSPEPFRAITDTNGLLAPATGQNQ